MKNDAEHTLVKSLGCKRNFAVVGSAGTGKSTLIKKLKEIGGNTVAVTSTTGLSALNIQGQTIHRFAGIKTYDDQKYLGLILRSQSWPRVLERLNETKTIIIDEVSMLKASQLDLLDTVLKSARRSSEPFGGVQVIVFGDPCQLPPIAKRGEVSVDIWFFKSSSWKEGHFKTILLKKVFRQKDEEFKERLGEIRIGQVSDRTNSYFENIENGNVEVNGAIRFLATNKAAKQTNENELGKINSEVKEFVPILSGKCVQSIAELKKDCIANDVLRIKVGARVMFVANDNSGLAQFVNGTMGVVSAFTEGGVPVVKTDDGLDVFVLENEWTVENYTGEVLARLGQTPLKLAYATTIHKSQGMTLDAIEVDCEGIFAEGQLYVALSRVKTSQGLSLKNWSTSYVKASKEAIIFCEGMENEY